MPDWNAADIVTWKESAKTTQQYYCDRLNDRHYDSFTAGDHKYLKLKIAFSCFGSPSNVEENDDEVDISAYKEDQRKCINLIFDQLVANSGSEIQVAFIFLLIKQYEQQYQLPVIRFKSSNNSELFLDHFARVYKSWGDFTEWNELPECLYCYPVNGWYRTNNDNVLLEYSTSPRCNVGETIVKYADYASIGGTIGSLALLGAGFIFPPAAPICLPAATWVGATSGAYGVARNTTKLVDRGSHGQSVNPFSDSQARSCWLGAVGGALGVGAMGAAKYVTYLAQEGEVASKIMRVTLNTMNIGSLTVNGVGIATNIYELSKKDEVTVLDVANLSLNILFFANTVVNLKTARTLIKDTQRNVLDSSKLQMDDQAQAGFKAFAKQNKKELRSTMYGNAKTIKGLKRIDNPNQFFAHLQQVRMDANGVAKNIRVRVNNDLLVSLNGELKVHPSKWATVNVEKRTKLLECASQINKEPENAFAYIKEVKKICSEEKIAFERSRENIKKVFAEKFGVSDAAHIEINGKKIFQNLRPHEIDRIGNVLESKGKHGTEDFIKCVKHVAEELGCKSPGEFCGIGEYCFEYINEVRQVKNVDGTKPKIAEVVNDLLASKDVNGGKMQELLKHFRQNKSLISELNKNASPGFATDVHATYHFYKHKAFGPKGEVTPEQYFEMIKEITGREDLRTSTTITQEGDKVIYTFTNPNDGAFCVVIEPLICVDNGGAFVATLFYNKRCHVLK